MKNRFERLSKEEQKAIVLEFANSSESRKDVIKRIKRIRVLSIIGMVYAVVLFLYAFLGEQVPVDYLIAAATFISCVILLVKSNSFKINVVNSYLVEKIRSKQKEDLKKEQAKKEKKKSTKK